MAKRKQGPSKIDQLVDALLEDGSDAEDLFGQDGLLKQLTRKMAERMLEAEMTDRGMRNTPHQVTTTVTAVTE
jgi:putative transposase